MKNKAISGKTKVCGIIGDPIEHTMSPAMHNAAFEKLGLDYVYVPFLVPKEALGRAIEGIRALGLRGLSVTIPHKVAVLPLLDKLDPLAEKIEAVNTIVNDNGVLTGYNTDASGFLQALAERSIKLEGKRAVILGAGGAARAICFALADQGASTKVLNRRSGMERARELTSRVSELSRSKVRALEMNEANLRTVIEESDLLVNATSVGMSPDDGQTPVPGDLLRAGVVVFDIIYNPIQTRLLKEAEKKGAQTINGIDMLVWQGASAFELWTGAKPPVADMRKAALKTLKSHED